MCAAHVLPTGVGPFAFRYQGNGATPCQYIDTTRKAIFGQPFVKRFALCYRTVVCPVCPVLCVTLVYCGQTAWWTKTPLGTEVDLRTDHIVLDGFPALRERGTALPSFRLMSIVGTVAHLCYC